MAKTKEQKKEIVKDLEDKFKKSKIVLFTSFGQHSKKGLDVKSMQNFKTKLKPIDAEFSVIKKTLMKRVMDNLSMDGKEDIEEIGGSLGVVFGYKDLILPAKEVYSLFKENKNLAINFGLTMEDGHQLISSEQIISLAKLPPKEVLLSQLAWGLKSPLYLLRNVLEANMRNLILVLKNIKTG